MSDLYLEISADSDMAKALIESKRQNLFLTLKEPGGTSIFRAQVSKWSIHNDGLVGIEFESWERYMERYAQLAGI